jgi:hypothetical protein
MNFWPNALAQENQRDPAKYDFSCLTRGQKQLIEVCFEQNDNCHKTLEKMTPAPADPPKWENYVVVLLGGMIVGAALSTKLGH